MGLIEGNIYYYIDRAGYYNINGIIEVKYLGNGKFAIQNVIIKPNKRYSYYDDDIKIDSNLLDPLDFSPETKYEIHNTIRIIFGWKDWQ